MSRGDRPESLPLDRLAQTETAPRESPETMPLAQTRPAEEVAAAAGPAAPRASRWPGRLAALGGGLLLAAGLAMAVEALLARALAAGLWTHWAALGGLGLLAAGVLGLALREALALSRLTRLHELQRRALAAPEAGREEAERVVGALEALYAARADLEWPLARFRERRQPQLDAADLLELCEIEVLGPLDDRAAQAIASAARRTTAVTAISPFGWLDMLASLTINLGLLGRIARIYGGRPGVFAGLRLLRLAFVNVLAAGAIDLADDTAGDLLGAGFAERLSTRAGSGVLNGLLTARLGLAGADLCRPLPWRARRRPAPRGLLKRALTNRGSSR